MKKWILATIVASTLFNVGHSQTVGIGNTSPNNKALLEIGERPGNQGLLLPRLKAGTITTLSGTYSGSEQGMLVYDIDNDVIKTWDGTAWNTIGGGADTDWSQTSSYIFNTSSRVGIGINFPTAKVHINGGGSDTALYVLANGTFGAVFEGANVIVKERLGVGTYPPLEVLHVGGNFRLEKAFMPGGVAGASGQYLISGGAGNPPTWFTKKITAFHARSVNPFGITKGSLGSGSDFDVLFIEGGGVVSTNGRYEVPTDGVYEVTAHVTVEPGGSPIETISLALEINNGTGIYAESLTQCTELDKNGCTASISVLVRLSASEIISLLVQSFNEDRASISNSGVSTTWFEAKLID